MYEWCLAGDKHNDMCEGENIWKAMRNGTSTYNSYRCEFKLHTNSWEFHNSSLQIVMNIHPKPWRPSHMTSTWLVTWLTHGWSHGWHMVGHMVYHMTKVTWHHMTWLGLPTPTSRDIPIHLEDPEPRSINITSYFQIFHQSKSAVRFSPSSLSANRNHSRYQIDPYLPSPITNRDTTGIPQENAS